MSLTGAALAGVALLGRCGAGAGSGQAQDQMPAMPAASRAALANPNLDLGTRWAGGRRRISGWTTSSASPCR